MYLNKFDLGNLIKVISDILMNRRMYRLWIKNV